MGPQGSFLRNKAARLNPSNADGEEHIIPYSCIYLHGVALKNSVNFYFSVSHSRVYLQMLPAIQLFKTFPALNGTQSFVTEFTRYHHLTPLTFYFFIIHFNIIPSSMPTSIQCSLSIMLSYLNDIQNTNQHIISQATHQHHSTSGCKRNLPYLDLL
jgi:hypothetical protein